MAFRPPPKLMLPLFRLHMIPTVDLRQLRVPERPCLGTPCPSFCRRGSRKALIRTVFADEAGRGPYSRLMCDKIAYIEPDIHPITRRIRVNPHTLALTWIYRIGAFWVPSYRGDSEQARTGFNWLPVTGPGTGHRRHHHGQLGLAVWVLVLVYARLFPKIHGAPSRLLQKTSQF